MELTNKNFEENFPKILEKIKECDFISLDFEFTGLHSSEANRESFLDTLQERYTKSKDSAEKFLGNQIGLCFFKWDEDKKKVIASPYNAYLFPRPYKRDFDPVFLSQASSLAFLATHGFNFSKWVHEGVQYIPENIAAQVRERGFEPTPIVKSEIAITSDRDVAFVKRTVECVKAWVEEEAPAEGEKAPLVLEPCNAFLRRVTFQEVRKAYPDLHMDSVNPPKPAEGAPAANTRDKCVRVSLMTEEQKAARAAELLAQAKEDFERSVGFTRVIRSIGESGKPLAVHNGLFDLMHCYAQFVGPLPTDVSLFKQLFCATFKNVMDTKYVAACAQPFQSPEQRFTSTGLGDLYSNVSSSPAFSGLSIELAEGHESYGGEGSEKHHEAGYDAYITGCVLAKLLHRLGNLGVEAEQKKQQQDQDMTESEKEDKATEPSSVESSVPTASGGDGSVEQPAVVEVEEAQQPAAAPPAVNVGYVSPASSGGSDAFKGMLFLLKSDVHFNLLDHDQCEASRRHVFKVSGFDQTVETSHIISLFAPYGDVSVRWIDTYSAYVVLRDPSNALAAERGLCGDSAPPPFVIAPVESSIAAVGSKRTAEEEAEATDQGSRKRQRTEDSESV